MLTAHQRLAIRSRLPEVRDIYGRHDREPVEIRIIRLRLDDGTEISICGLALNKASRSRLAGDYSDRVEHVPIPAEMRARLEAVFGPLRYRGDG